MYNYHQFQRITCILAVFLTLDKGHPSIADQLANRRQEQINTLRERIADLETVSLFTFLILVVHVGHYTFLL